MMFLIATPLFAQAQTLAHELSLVLRPDLGEILVEDRITLTSAVAEVEFVLNAGLEASTGDGTLIPLSRSSDGVRKAYRLVLEQPSREVRLSYRGQPVFGQRRSMGGMPVGEVSADGVYLDGRSAWYPLVEGPVTGLDLRVTVPSGWEALSVGRRSLDGGVQRWTTDKPHDDLYLIAGPFTRHATSHAGTDLSVWLLQDDPGLARRYLSVMGDYLDHYSAMIGPYPFAKFAVVENRWQTGFGMPSFTLLGSRVIRLPFIPFTSLPHEILHNWWGNGVWVDYAGGNWSEGLTAYLADHWMQERQGKGDQYRLKALQRYTNFAAEGEDSPLLDFVSRHNETSQSIGYSKSLMVFHMLRRALGDEAFVAGLQRLWETHRFTAIGFEQSLRTLASAEGTLDADWQRWLETRGAPRLGLEAVSVAPDGDGFTLTFDLTQAQPKPFAIDVPVAVMLEGRAEAAETVHRISGERERLTLRFEQRPLRLDIDPAFDVLRQLDPSEQPAALNRLFGGHTWLILPGAAGDAMRDAWRSLATQWQQRYPTLRTIGDDEADTLPPGANRLLLGWDNRLLASSMAALQRDDHRLADDGLRIGQQHFRASDSPMALVNNDTGGVTTGFLGAADPGAVATLARKLPHYGSYGRLVFDGNSGKARVRDSLPSSHSVLSRQLGGEPVALQLARQPVLGAN